ncbi:guanylate kinase [bacterium]|nr:guanylate kinase [bacterium]
MKKLFVISGSSGVGKGTVIKKFLEKNPKFKLSVSCTTRAKRPGEEHGVNYYYLTREEFDKAVENGDFLEWAEFSGNCYGTNKKFVQQCLDNEEDLLLEIDTQGALQVKKKMNNAVLIFILPPSLEELEKRLRGRGTETEDAIQKRLNTVKSEMENAKEFHYNVINDEVDSAVEEIENIIKNEQV